MKHPSLNPATLSLVRVGFGMGVFGFGSCADSDGPSWNGQTISVEARGVGRAWRFSYPGVDGKLGTEDDLVSHRRLRVPTGAEVVLQLRSEDFIYVFSCPDLSLKEIAVPDLAFTLAFKVEHERNYDLAMDPMCGFQLPPGKTMGTLEGCSKSSFNRWLGELSKAP